MLSPVSSSATVAQPKDQHSPSDHAIGQQELSRLQVAVIRQVRKNLKTIEGRKLLRDECGHQRRMRELRGLIWSQMENKDKVDRQKLQWLFSLYDIRGLGVIDE